jgi:alpha-beta hydrolase superfamily lysophospholipase/SAM-dependent methyltransferase
MNAQHICSESGFSGVDRTRLFYRAWQPVKPRTDGAPRALVFLHRGHEHSGRVASLVERFGYTQDWAFAWDARGHGHSPGERGDAPGFETLVQDLEAFMRHIQAVHGIAPENTVLVANSVGAVIAATWLHDYAPRVRGVVMAAAAFDINLYVPMAKPALRLAMRFKPGLFVTSYIRSSMLTHSPQQASAYDADPLITRNIAARVLLSLAETAKRVVADAKAIDTPILMLVADQDYVVKQAPQRKFFERINASLKRYLVLKNCRHAIFYETDATALQAIVASQEFIDKCFSQELPALESYHCADVKGPAADCFEALRQGKLSSAVGDLFYGFQKLMLGSLGTLSNGMRIGLQHGFDSGASLDYVYRNQAGGRWLIGGGIDRGYLDAIGWRGIRQRKQHLQQALSEVIASYPKDKPLRVLDIAAGSGRYLLEFLKLHQERHIDIVLRDFDQNNLDRARELANALELKNNITYQCRDAFNPDSYPKDEPPYDIVIVSGLYELFSDNGLVLQSLRAIQSQLQMGGHLIYTGQPWHPQLVLIAKTLTDHKGNAWTMRPRPQAEMDGLVGSVGLRKISSKVGVEGIFTVSVARSGAAVPNAVD